MSHASQFDFDLIAIVAGSGGGDRAPMAKQKAEETYPKHTPVDNNIGNSSDEVVSTPLPVPDDACPYK